MNIHFQAALMEDALTLIFPLVAKIPFILCVS